MFCLFIFWENQCFCYVDVFTMVYFFCWIFVKYKFESSPAQQNAVQMFFFLNAVHSLSYL